MTLTDAILQQATPEALVALLEQGANPNAVDIYGFTPLIEAAIANRLDLAQCLVQYGADCKARDLTGGTALHWAAENNNVPLCRFLLEQGADPNAYNQAGQSVLLQPLLRQQKALKELLYQHGADLKFTQDYICAKLLGHRFELTGTVDIVDPEGTFIPIDYEGFIPEFTVNLIRHSLLQFKNNFSARNLRAYASELKVVLEAFTVASDTVRYQHHLAPLSRRQERVKLLMAQEALLLPVGYEGHSISFIRYKDLFAKCDRGENSLYAPSAGIYHIGNLSALSPSFLQGLLFERQSTEFVTRGIFEVLELRPVTALPLPSQLTGNCSWANMEAALPTLLCMQWVYRDPPRTVDQLQVYQTQALNIYRQWQTWDQDWALHQCIENFYAAEAARKASLASLLAAVLFQTCRYTQASDKERAHHILAALATPEYRGILKLYLDTYKNTLAGRNLAELVDVYGR